MPGIRTLQIDAFATLAAAHALWTEGVVRRTSPIRFHTRSGVLTCTTDGDLIELDFPATPAHGTFVDRGFEVVRYVARNPQS